MAKTSSLNPYLIFNGDCEAALEFYRAVFGSEILHLSRYEDGPMPTPDGWKKKVLHAAIEIHGVLVMASDGRPDYREKVGENVFLSLSFDGVEIMEERFKRLSEGGEVLSPLQDMFWGARFGMVADRFGVRWMFTHESARK